MTNARTHRFAAFAFAAFMTLAMLAGVDGLATPDLSAEQMAHVVAQQRA